MIRKTPLNKPDKVLVTFELPACTWATRINVCGDFNDWSKTGLPMCQARDGVWRAEIELPMNQEYQFRYLIDGNWQTDYHADSSAPNGFGSENSVVNTGILPSQMLQDIATPQVEVVRQSQIREAMVLERTQPVRRPAHTMRHAA